MEIHGIGPCVFIDTPGFDDEGELGEMRIARTLQAIERTDIALLLLSLIHIYAARIAKKKQSVVSSFLIQQKKSHCKVKLSQ